MANQFTSPTGETKSVRLARIASERVGQNRTGSGIVTRALTAIDLERVSSAPGVIRAFVGIVEQVQADRELSDHGKRARIEAAATSRLGNLASVARDVAGLEREHSAAKAEAVKLEKADAADMLLDLRLAEYVREREPIPTVLVQMSERIRVAVARLPAELSGITPETQARVMGSLVSPQAAVRFEEEAEALSAARAVVQAGIDELAPLAGWQPAELVQHFGADWKLPGVVAPFADRMVAAQASAEAA